MNLPEDDILENTSRLSDRQESAIDTGVHYTQPYTGDFLGEPLQDVVVSNDRTSAR